VCALDSTGTVRALAHVSASYLQVSSMVLGTRTLRTRIRVRRCIKSVPYCTPNRIPEPPSGKFTAARTLCSVAKKMSDTAQQFITFGSNMSPFLKRLIYSIRTVRYAVYFNRQVTYNLIENECNMYWTITPYTVMALVCSV